MMKTKVLAWILAILCISMMVVGCSKECTEHIDENKDGICDQCEATITCTTHTDADNNQICDVCGGAVTPSCELHVDADANLVCDVCGAAVEPVCDHKDTNADKLCDACGGAIVVITQQTPPAEETRVSMVVNTAPADAVLGDYVYTDIHRDVPQSVTMVGDYNYSHQKYFLFTKTEGDNIKYEVKNLATDAVIYTVTKPNTTVVDINLENDYIFVSIIGNPLNDYIYLSYAGEVLYKTQANALEAPTFDSQDWHNYTKLTIAGKVFMIDPDTDAVLLKNADPSTVFYRPYFDEKNAGFGAVREQQTLYVYDLSKWLDCAVSYDIPGYWENVDWFMLENGSVILQGELPLPNDAVSYDFIEYGEKYDLIHVLLDPVARTTKEIEFGYVINNVAFDRYTYSYYGCTDKVANVVDVYAIVDDRIDDNNDKTLFTDNTLKVLYDLDNAFDGRTFTPIGNGLFCVYEPLTASYEIYNAAGEHVSVGPDSISSGYFYYDNGVWYDLTGKKLAAEAEGAEMVLNGYNAYSETSYAIFKITEGADVTYWYYGGKGLVKIDLANITDITTTEYGFVVTHTVEGADQYTLYNEAGKSVCKLVGEPYSDYMNRLAEGVYAFECYDNTQGVYVTYLVKF